MTATRANKVMKNIERKQPQAKKSKLKNNKAQTAEQDAKCQTLIDEMENAKQNIIMSTEQRASIIIKHRRRLYHAGVLQQLVIEMFI